MRRSIVIFLCVFLQTQCENNFVIKNTAQTRDANPVASCVYGRFQGTYNVTRMGRRFESYRGIRYAEAPVGSMRFEPPKMIQRYKETVNATMDGAICPQISSSSNNFSYSDMDEDCLMVNVYTPLRKDRRSLLPVVVYIHQGAFSIRTGRSDVCGPNYLLDRDLVFVTFNYRLGSLGFLSTGDALAPGNNGLKDQVALLKWVKRFIVAFGGNPGRVTIFGYSAGAASVASHLVSPMSKGLFHRAIALGGSTTRVNETKTDLYDLAVKQAEFLDCPTDNSTVIVECLKQKPWMDFATSFPRFLAFANNPAHFWEPIAEKEFGQERFLTMNVMDYITQGKLQSVPIVVAQDTAEDYPFAYPILTNETLLQMANDQWDDFATIAFILPEKNKTTALEVLRSFYLKNETLSNDQESADRLGTLYGDSLVAFAVGRLAKLMAIHSKRPVWYSLFSYVGNNSYIGEFSSQKPTFAVHQDETIYFLSQPFLFPDIGKEGGDAEIVNKMTGFIYNVARYGNPVRKDSSEWKGVTWPPLTPNNRIYLQFDKEFSLHRNLKEERLQTWEELYPINYGT